MNLTKHLPQSWHHRKFVWWILAAATIAIIVVIVVPLAVILPRKHNDFHRTTVVLPLYIYPENESSWDLMFTAAAAHPNLPFLVIVNPNSGPGESTLPNSDYVTAINKLNSFDNVQTVGYVRTGYATRNISDVIDEVNIYAGWHSADGYNLTMHGIFFDESPHEYTSNAVTFMQTVDEAARNASGIQTPKTIIHNTGVIPAERFLTQTHPNITVVFEESFSVWQKRGPAVEAMSDNRTENCIMMNSVPEYSNTTLAEFLDTLSAAARYIFITDRSTDYYEYFSNDWEDFTDAVRVEQ